jgi:hypothetical protein
MMRTGTVRSLASKSMNFVIAPRSGYSARYKTLVFWNAGPLPRFAPPQTPFKIKVVVEGFRSALSICRL